jgi:hypothetical protein
MRKTSLAWFAPVRAAAKGIRVMMAHLPIFETED